MRMPNFECRVPSCLVLTVCLLAGCASPPPPPSNIDPELSRVTKTARAAFQEGQIQQAARLYVRGLKMARAVDNAREIGSIAYNLSACLIQLGEYEAASRYLAEALREFERAGRSPMDILLLQADVARAEGRPGQALALLDKAASMPDGKASSYRVQIALAKAELACDRGNVATATAELDSVKKVLRRITDPMVHGKVAGVTARIALLNKKPADAAVAYDEQADFYQQAEKFGSMARALGRAGEAYLSAGIYTPAADRFYRAGRSLYAQGDELDALKMVKGALDAIEKGGEKDSLERTVMLFNEIKESVEEAETEDDDQEPET